MDERASGKVSEVSIFIEVLEFGELRKVGVPDVAMKREAGAAAFALDVDKASVGQLLEMVRDGCRTEDLLLCKGAALYAVAAGDLLEDGEAARVGEGAGDGLHPIVGESRCAFRHDYLMVIEGLEDQLCGLREAGIWAGCSVWIVTS
jgi:hypothetical protein